MQEGTAQAAKARALTLMQILQVIMLTMPAMRPSSVLPADMNVYPKALQVNTETIVPTVYQVFMWIFLPETGQVNVKV